MTGWGGIGNEVRSRSIMYRAGRQRSGSEMNFAPFVAMADMREAAVSERSVVHVGGGDGDERREAR